VLYLFFPPRFIPFSGGPRKCVGDQFALLEAIVALAVVLQKIEFQLVPDQKISMTTGATIHTANVRTLMQLFLMLEQIAKHHFKMEVHQN
jgi:cytochrome P450